MKARIKLTAREKLMFKLGRNLERYYESSTSSTPAHERREFRALRLLDAACSDDSQRDKSLRAKARDDLYSALMCELIAIQFVGSRDIPIGKLFSIYDDFRKLGVKGLPVTPGTPALSSDEEPLAFW